MSINPSGRRVGSRCNYPFPCALETSSARYRKIQSQSDIKRRGKEPSKYNPQNSSGYWKQRVPCEVTCINISVNDQKF